MTIVPEDDFRPLLHLVCLGAVGAATIGIFFGVGFLWLAPPRPAAPPADTVLPAQTFEPREVPSSADSDPAPGSSPGTPVATVAATTTPDTPSKGEAAAIETTLIPPAGITHKKRVHIRRHPHHATGRHWAASWRVDASSGPNPGGGFYGPPNVNVGYINPR
jgi:hypothetical protein